jgi:hypothetical protein
MQCEIWARYSSRRGASKTFERFGDARGEHTYGLSPKGRRYGTKPRFRFVRIGKGWECSARIHSIVGKRRALVSCALPLARTTLSPGRELARFGL